MLAEGQVITNTNGSQYKVVVPTIGSYTLLKQMNCTSPYSQPFVVAWCLNEYEKGYCWGQGHYFSKLETALEVFDEKTCGLRTIAEGGQK